MSDFYLKLYKLNKEYIKLYEETLDNENCDDLEATADHIRAIINEYLP